jgi:hypothetical protein
MGKGTVGLTIGSGENSGWPKAGSPLLRGMGAILGRFGGFWAWLRGGCGVWWFRYEGMCESIEIEKSRYAVSKSNLVMKTRGLLSENQNPNSKSAALEHFKWKSHCTPQYSHLRQTFIQTFLPSCENSIIGSPVTNTMVFAYSHVNASMGAMFWMRRLVVDKSLLVDGSRVIGE